MGKKIKLGEEVGVIGGGNSAIDTARTALRLGADKVTILYRRTEKEMPASAEEIEEAKKEGVKIEFLVAPVKAEHKNAKIQLTLQRMKLGDIDKSGRPRPVPISGSEFELKLDQIITAIGQRPAISEKLGLQLNSDGTIKVNSETLETSIKGVFAGGDVVLGPASVIEAIAMGRKASMAIDRYLGGKGIIDEKLVKEELGKNKLPRAEEKKERRRERMRFTNPKQRIKNFRMVELGYSKAQSCKEASRCLQCDLEEK